MGFCVYTMHGASGTCVTDGIDGVNISERVVGGDVAKMTSMSC